MFESFKKERIRRTKLFKFKPDTDLIIALATLLIMWVSYYGVMKVDWYHNSPTAQILIFVLLTNTLLAVAFPIWWVKKYRKQSLSELGITKKYLLASLIISTIIAAWRGISMFSVIEAANSSYILPTFVASALIFWEPFFVFSWLQTRYEKSFGIVPAIILAASSIVLYQIGSASPTGLFDLFAVYIVLATAFSLTKNIFALWPIYWCIGSSVNQLSLSMNSGWDVVAVYAIAIIIQFGIIFYFYKNRI
jgi:hypothetical protein